MKYTLHAAVVLFFALLVRDVSQAQWISTTGIEGGQINCLEVLGSDTYAGTWGGGAFKSTNQGASWTYSGMLGQKIRSMAAQSPNIFAGTHTGVWLSTDNGGNWNPVNSSGQSLQYVYAMAASGAYLVAGGYGGITRTTDAGNTWEYDTVGLTSPAFPVPDVRAIAGPSSHLFCGIPGFGISVSTDNGKNWNRTAAQPGDMNIQALAVTGTTLFAGTQGGVFVSTNYGTSWSNFSSGLGDPNVKSLTFKGTNIFAGTATGGAFVSPVASAAWTVVNNGLGDHGVLALIVNINLLAGTNGGVFSSANDGALWTAANTGLTATRVYTMGVNGSTLFAGAYGSGLFRSTNDGATWTNTGVANHYFHSMLVNGSSVYAGSESGLYYSTNNGTSWTAAATGLGVADGRDVRAIASRGGKLYAGVLGGGVYTSTDGGANWVQSANSGLTILDVWALVLNGSTLYAGIQGTGVFSSTDDGATWTSASNGIVGSEALYINALAISGNTLFAGTGTGLWTSTNGGALWTDITGNLGSNFIFCILPSGTNFFVGTRNGGGLFYSKTFAPPYTDVGDAAGLGNTWVSSMGINGTELYLGTSGAGVWRRPLTQMGYQVHAAAKVYLQGPYVTSGDSMAIALKTGGQLATHFGAIPIPTRAVDSIMVELRNDSTAAGSTIRKFAPAWLLSNGTIRNFADTTKSYVDFDSLLGGKYYTVIHHRNHLAVMSALKDSVDAYASPAGHDFSAVGQAYGFLPMPLVGTHYCLYAGDANGDGQINATDRTLSFDARNLLGYLLSDFNLDGQVNASDRTIAFDNRNDVSRIP